MQDDKPDVPSAADTRAASASTARAERIRERLRQAQIIAAQAARARTAGGQPSDDEAARLVADFHARGGQVTVCPTGDAMQASTEQNRSGPDTQGTT
jgi:hypothetical protein